MPTTLQRAPREDFTMPRGEFASARTAPGLPNWGGAKPMTPATPAPRGRNLGTMTSADLSRSVNDRGMPLGGVIGQKPSLTGASFAPQTGGYAEYTPRTPATPTALAARAPYNPPQQTERANPLTGDNNIPMEGQTTPLVRAPFVQRGAATPSGQDASAAVRTTLTEDNDIGTAMNGTLGRIGGTGSFARRFGSPQAADAYTGYLKRIFPQG